MCQHAGMKTLALVSQKGGSAPPCREGKRALSVYINPAAAKQLRLPAAENDRTGQAMVEEALNGLFRKHAKSAIA